MKNLLFFDVGNTNVVIAIYCDNKLINKWRLKTDYLRTADEYASILYNHFKMNDLDFKDIKAIVISSVVPKVNEALSYLTTRYFDCEVLYVNVNVNTGLTFNIENKNYLGADLVAGAVAAYHKYKQTVIIVDLGTATTISVVDKKGVYHGGIISLGLKTAALALTDSAAKLPSFDLKAPLKAIGKETISAMQSGIVLGYVSMVEGLINKVKKEIISDEINEEDIKVILTGGQAKYIADLIEIDYTYDDDLLLEGILMIYQLNKNIFK